MPGTQYDKIFVEGLIPKYTKQEQLDFLYNKYKEKKQQYKELEELRIKERVQAEGRYQLLRREMEQVGKRRDNLKRLY